MSLHALDTRLVWGGSTELERPAHREQGKKLVCCRVKVDYVSGIAAPSGKSLAVLAPGTRGTPIAGEGGIR